MRSSAEQCCATYPLAEIMTSETKGIVLRIEKTSIHDGTGLRTVVFLKGCPLKCDWCSTPEGQRGSIEIGFIRQKCDECGICIYTCPEGCFFIEDDGTFALDLKKCTHCQECIESCLQGAIQCYGQKMTDRQVLEQISRDEIFYFFSGGGVTISGGECLTQPDFVKSILEECRARGIDTTMETSLFADWDSVAKVLPYLNSLYVDIKHSDSAAHKTITGVGSELIWENLKRIDELDLRVPIYIRVPLIPGVNDSDTNLQTILAMVSELKKVRSVELLPYHKLGVSTYEYMGREYSLKDLQTPSAEYLDERGAFLRSQNAKVPVKITR
ncbi:MAG: glycyl-radical enzyme activating protein [Desulforhopalus sp.]